MCPQTRFSQISGVQETWVILRSSHCGSASPSLSAACLGRVLDVLMVTRPGTWSIWGQEISRHRREGGALCLMKAARQQEPGVVLVAHGDGISSHRLAPPVSAFHGPGGTHRKDLPASRTWMLCYPRVPPPGPLGPPSKVISTSHEGKLDSKTRGLEVAGVTMQKTGLGDGPFPGSRRDFRGALLGERF